MRVQVNTSTSPTQKAQAILDDSSQSPDNTLENWLKRRVRRYIAQCRSVIITHELHYIQHYTHLYVTARAIRRHSPGRPESTAIRCRPLRTSSRSGARDGKVSSRRWTNCWRTTLTARGWPISLMLSGGTGELVLLEQAGLRRPQAVPCVD
jgi:hypothetical protein